VGGLAYAFASYSEYGHPLYVATPFSSNLRSETTASQIFLGFNCLSGYLQSIMIFIDYDKLERKTTEMRL